MLRPAFLLPLSEERLLTPRSGHRDLSLCLGPATRRSDAYRDGTLTRWRSAARSSRLEPRKAQLFHFFAAHHETSLTRAFRRPSAALHGLFPARIASSDPTPRIAALARFGDEMRPREASDRRRPRKAPRKSQAESSQMSTL